MKLSTFLMIKAIISLVFGIAFVLGAATVMSFYGITLDASGASMAQLLGACLIGIGLICWLNSGAAGSVLQNIILALFIADTIGFILSLLFQLSGPINSLGWLNVAIWLLLALGLGYFRFLKPSTA